MPLRLQKEDELDRERSSNAPCFILRKMMNLEMNTERVAGRHRNRLEVEELLRDYAGSGLSRREFCRSRGVGVSTLGHHLKRSRQELAGRSISADCSG